MLISVHQHRNTFACYAALAVACLAWGFELVFPCESSLVQFILGAITLLSVVASFQFGRMRYAHLVADLTRVINQLASQDLEELVRSGDLERIAIPHSEACLRTSFTRLRDSLSELVGRVHDVDHARAGAEVRIRRTATERDQLRDLLMAVDDPVIAIDAFDDIFFANGTAEKLLGLSCSNHRYGNIAILTLPAGLCTLLQETRKRHSGFSRSATIAIHDEAGNEKIFRVSCRPLLGSTGSGDAKTVVCGAIAVFSDIGSQRDHQKRNAEFVSAASHEMKAPLAAIHAYVELLADGEADDEAHRQEFLEVIQSQAERLQRLVENLLNLARIEAGVVQVDKKPRSLNEVLQQAYNVLLPAAEQKQIQLVCDLSPLYLAVYADHDTLLQAAINLGSNAVKYTPNGGRVTLSSRSEEHEIIFDVRDTGVGLNEEDRVKVFERFYRVKKDSNMAPGTGLGLPLVKHIVEDVHSGRIEVESELGQGSTFRVILPATDQITLKS